MCYDGCVDEKADITFIKRWLDQLPEERIEQHIQELDKRLSALSAEIATWREALQLKRRFQDLYIPQIAPDQRVHVAEHGIVTERASVKKHEERPASIKESVLRVMEEDPAKEEWTVDDLFNALVGRRWLETTNQALRSLGAALSRMTAEGSIKRVRRGVYKRATALASAPQSLTELGGESD